MRNQKEGSVFQPLYRSVCNKHLICSYIYISRYFFIHLSLFTFPISTFLVLNFRSIKLFCFRRRKIISQAYIYRSLFLNRTSFYVSIAGRGSRRCMWSHKMAHSHSLDLLWTDDRSVGGLSLQEHRQEEIWLRQNVLLSLCIWSLLGSFSWLSLILPFVFTYNTQHKHPCPRRNSNPQLQEPIGPRLSP